MELQGIILKIQNTYAGQETTGYKVTLELPDNDYSKEQVKQLYDYLNSVCEITIEKQD